MKGDIKDFLSSKGVEWREATSLADVAPAVDVLYMTRIQKERFADPADYAAAKGKYVIDAGVMAALRRDAVVLHPLPRVDEVRGVCVGVCGCGGGFGVAVAAAVFVTCARARALDLTAPPGRHRSHTHTHPHNNNARNQPTQQNNTHTQPTDRDRGRRRPARRVLPPGAQRPVRAHGAAQALPARLGDDDDDDDERGVLEARAHACFSSFSPMPLCVRARAS